MNLTRRNLFHIGLVGGAGAAVAHAPRLIPGDATPAVDQLAALDLHRDLPEEWLPSVCAACAAAYPLWLRRIGSNVVGVRPTSHGACARAYTVPQELVHPDRVRAPLQASGRRGSGAFQTISLDAALAQIADILRRGGSKTAVVVPESAALSVGLLRALGRALGTPHVYVAEWTSSQTPADALAHATGWRHWRYDIEHAVGLISFGWDWLQAHPDPAEAQRAFASLRDRNAPLYFVGPRFNPTGCRGHEWIACRPGFEPLVALAVAHVLLKDGRIPPAAGLESVVEALGKFDLAAAERRAGVSQRRIRELAQIAATRQPCLCLGRRDRLEDQWPAVVLNALLGNIGRTSGGLLPIPETELRTGVAAGAGSISQAAGGATVPPPAAATAPDRPQPRDGSYRTADELLPILVAGGAIEAVLLVGVNPVFTGPAPRLWREALERVKHVICATSFVDETATAADLIVPLALPAERQDAYVDRGNGRWLAVPSDPAAPRTSPEPPAAGQEPNAPPRPQSGQATDSAAPAPWFDPVSISSGEVISPAGLAFELARRLELPPAAFPWKALADAARGLAVRAPTLAGVHIPAEAAAWTLPHFGEGEFHLLLETPVTLPRGEGGHLPALMTTIAPHLREWWTTWVEVNPDTARRLGLRERDLVVVESKAGSIQARVKPFAGVPHDAVCMAIGLGHRIGTFAQNEGGNPAELIEYRPDQSSRIALWNIQKVNIRRL
jgi:molybdopterin-containing oxidoreductase family iron-sulfur binding subunit